MNSGVMIVFVIIALVVGVGQIGGCVECERSGGVYVKTVYGWHECIRK